MIIKVERDVEFAKKIDNFNFKIISAHRRFRSKTKNTTKLKKKNSKFYKTDKFKKNYTIRF